MTNRGLALALFMVAVLLVAMLVKSREHHRSADQQILLRKAR